MNRFGLDSAEILLEKIASGAVDRRAFLHAAGALGLLATLRPTAALAADEIVLCNWGGAAVDAFQEAYGEPFTAKTGMPRRHRRRRPGDRRDPRHGRIRQGHLGRDGRRHDRRRRPRQGRLRRADRLYDRRQDQGRRQASQPSSASRNYTFSNVLVYNAKIGRGDAAGRAGPTSSITAKYPGQAHHVQVDPGPARVRAASPTASPSPTSIRSTSTAPSPRSSRCCRTSSSGKAARRASSCSATARS